MKLLTWLQEEEKKNERFLKAYLLPKFVNNETVSVSLLCYSIHIK